MARVQAAEHERGKRKAARKAPAKGVTSTKDKATKGARRRREPAGRA